MEKLSSKELAELIIDALLIAEILEKKEVEKAIKITAEEIEVRKCMGDY